ncbi:putative secreted protein [Propionispora sp. 2/2-37]|uniref:DUF2291 family protein n=1 Tax=Propionispora sp. 2/2-37 TaxID=1677858 RepID=UPI0006BB5E6A|nr:DUF2291 domain-containing protein [Propionispora sp. 2/2-37]CUH95305.1 putative secreted protein [Propionispora sp. 2/2-37]
MNKMSKTVRAVRSACSLRNRCVVKWKTSLLVVVCLFSAVLFSGCKLYTVVSNDKSNDKQGNTFYFQDNSFDANQFVESVWDSKVMPAVNQKAADIGQVLKEARNNMDEAGGKYGFRSAQEGSAWNFIVKGQGKVLKVSRESRAGTLDIDLPPYDGKTEFKIQIGPVIKGTAVRDSLDFIKYDDFKNQMVFAELSNAFHKRIADSLLNKTDFSTVEGKEVIFTGAFTFTSFDAVVVTPLTLEFTEGGS